MATKTMPGVTLRESYAIPATSRSSEPSTRRGESWLTSCFNCIDTSKISPRLSGRQRPIVDCFSKGLDGARSRFLLRGNVRLNVELQGDPFGNTSENRGGGFPTVVASPPPVRGIEHDQDADLRVIGWKEPDKVREIPARTVGKPLGRAGFAGHGVMLKARFSRGAIGRSGPFQRLHHEVRRL